MKERVLITGASGFLGFHLINAALQANLDVFAAVRSKSNISHLSNLHIKIVQLDYENPFALAEDFKEKKYNYIIHAAGITKANTEAEYNLVNNIYSDNLALAASKIQDHLKRFVFISSLAAAGPLKGIEGTIDESITPNPVTAYGRSKLNAEKKLCTYDFPVTILRPTAIYGPRERDLFLVANYLKKGLDPHIGKFKQKLSFVHGKDVAALAVKALFLEQANGIYNVTDGHVYGRYDYGIIIKKILNKKAFRVHIPIGLLKIILIGVEKINKSLNKVSPVNREKLNELAAENWSCDISKAKNILGYLPVYDLELGLKESIDWYVENKWL